MSTGAQPASTRARAAVWILVLGYVGLFSWLAVTRHQAFGTDAYDMGNVNQAMWNTVRGRPLYFTNWRGVELSLAYDSRLAMHVEPIYFLVAPLYLLWQRPESLLILQSVILGLGAWPVYWLARERLESHLGGVAFVAVYLLFPGLQAANLWEFHAVALAAPLLLAAFYFGQARRWALLWLFATLAMATKEEVPLTVALMGLYFALLGMARSDSGVILQRLRRREVTHGLALALVAGAWFLVAFLVIIPHFEGDSSPYLYYLEGALGQVEGASSGEGGILGAAAAFLTERNIAYLVDLYTPVAFLSLLSPLTLAFSFPDLVINLLSDHEPMHFVQKYHYVAPLLPGVIISAILGAARLGRWLSALTGLRYRASVMALVVCILAATGYYHYFHGYTPLARAFERYTVTPHYRLGATIAQEIPAGASVSAQRHLNPQVSGRKTLYRYPYIADADYVFLDVSTLQNEFSLYSVARDLLAGDEFGLIRAEDGFLLLQRGVPSTRSMDDRFYRFARTDLDASSPQHRVDVVFGEGLRLVGFDVFAGRRTEMPQTPLRFTLYWQPAAQLEKDLHFALYLLDEQRQVVGGPDFSREPGIIPYWYPTPLWRPGETIQMKISNMPWWTAQFDCYSVALGVLREESPWDVEARLPLEIGRESLQLALADNGTLVELMGFCTDPGGMPMPIAPWAMDGPPPSATKQEALWNNGLLLAGHETRRDRIQPGETLAVSLYWRTQEPIAADYTVFVHMIGQDGRLYAQHDSQPDMGGYPTSRWQVGRLIRDRHPVAVSPDTPPGEYALVVGFYDPATGERVSLSDGQDAARLAASILVR